MKKKVFKSSLLALVFGVLISQSVLASYTSYSQTNWSVTDRTTWGSYHPLSGYLAFGQYTTNDASHPGKLRTNTYFTLDQTNVNSIIAYNNGTKSCGNAGVVQAYLTVDNTATGDSWNLEIDASSVTSSLPSPKVDIDAWSNGGWDGSEAEATALGTVKTGTAYNTFVYWNDNRDGDANDSGEIALNINMSNKGVTEYNTCTNPDDIRTISYGNYKNQK
ncbi:MAG: hypothetical protein KKD36_04630 [Bacteroidetes bacterium]|nr:hypothetical protein [Bacteroidota bacterium]